MFFTRALVPYLSASFHGIRRFRAVLGLQFFQLLWRHRLRTPASRHLLSRFTDKHLLDRILIGILPCLFGRRAAPKTKDGRITGAEAAANVLTRVVLFLVSMPLAARFRSRRTVNGVGCIAVGSHSALLLLFRLPVRRRPLFSTSSSWRIVSRLAEVYFAQSFENRPSRASCVSAGPWRPLFAFWCGVFSSTYYSRRERGLHYCLSTHHFRSTSVR